MKISINTKEFRKLTAHFDAILKKKLLGDVLRSVLLKAKDGCITATVTDMDIELISIVPGTILNEGAGLIYIDDIQALNQLAGDIYITVEDGKCSFTSDFKYECLAMDSKVYPKTTPFKVSEPIYSIPEKELLAAFKLKEITIARDYYRHSDGLWIDEKNIVACDGSRIGKIKSNNFCRQPFPLPNKIISILEKLLVKSSEDQLRFYYWDEFIKIEIGPHSILYSIDITKEFINYKAVFDTHPINHIYIFRNPFLEAVKFISDTHKRSTSGDKFAPKEFIRFDYHNHILKMSYDAYEKSINKRFPVDAQKPEIDFSILLNPELLCGTLKLIKGDIISLLFSGSMNPAILRGIKYGEETYLLLPMSENKKAA